MAATGKHAPFRLWILIVAWILQLLFLIFELGLFIIVALAISLSSVATNVTYGVVGVEISLASSSIILIIVEIVLCDNYILSPLFYLVSNATKSAMWIGLVIAALVISHGYKGDTWDGVAYTTYGIAVSVATMLLFLIPMIYGAILYHKDRKSIAALSSYSTPVYNVPTGSESIQYQGAPIPRPEFVDVEDGQGHGFRKTDQYGIKTRATAYDGQTQNLLGNGPQKTMYA